MSAQASDRPHGPLLDVRDLHVWLRSDLGPVRAVDGVSLTLERGETLGLVGESGSGKTQLARAIMGLTPRKIISHESGQVRFEGVDLRALDDESLRDIWGLEIAMVFQNPLTSLNPVVPIGRQITESLDHHLDMPRAEATETAIELLNSVGIPEAERRYKEYPHQLSGGMRQRVGIAIALACGPKLLIADEPTTALDVTIQRQILDLLAQQQTERFMAMILITHDLGVVAGRADQIAVMYAGRVVEHAPTLEVFQNTRHPYTEALLLSIPHITSTRRARLASIPGRPPDLVHPPVGCSFAPRCNYAQARCVTEDPTLATVPGTDHAYACFFPAGSDEGRLALEHNRRTGQNAFGTPVEIATTGAT